MLTTLLMIFAVILLIVDQPLAAVVMAILALVSTFREKL